LLAAWLDVEWGSMLVDLWDYQKVAWMVALKAYKSVAVMEDLWAVLSVL
jgi:hypothetical protein